MNNQGLSEAGSSRGTASDAELLKRFQPVFVLSVKEVKRLKRKEKDALRRERNIREGVHSCALCPYKGGSRSELTTHHRTHTGEKSYQCDQCQFSASQKCALDKHKLTHSGMIKNFA